MSATDEGRRWSKPHQAAVARLPFWSTRMAIATGRAMGQASDRGVGLSTIAVTMQGDALLQEMNNRAAECSALYKEAIDASPDQIDAEDVGEQFRATCNRVAKVPDRFHVTTAEALGMGNAAMMRSCTTRDQKLLAHEIDKLASVVRSAAAARNDRLSDRALQERMANAAEKVANKPPTSGWRVLWSAVLSGSFKEAAKLAVTLLWRYALAFVMLGWATFSGWVHRVVDWMNIAR